VGVRGRSHSFTKILSNFAPDPHRPTVLVPYTFIPTTSAPFWCSDTFFVRPLKWRQNIAFPQTSCNVLQFEADAEYVHIFSSPSAGYNWQGIHSVVWREQGRAGTLCQRKTLLTVHKCQLVERSREALYERRSPRRR